MSCTHPLSMRSLRNRMPAYVAVCSRSGIATMAGVRWPCQAQRVKTVVKASVSNSNHTSETGLAAAAKVAVQSSRVDPSRWDLDWWHYTPKWYKPHYVVIAGLSFIIGCNLATAPSLKTTVIALAPVAVGWYIFLWMVPRQFSDFAKKYIETHPECEAHALEHARQCAEANKQEH